MFYASLDNDAFKPDLIGLLSSHTVLPWRNHSNTASNFRRHQSPSTVAREIKEPGRQCAKNQVIEQRKPNTDFTRFSVMN